MEFQVQVLFIPAKIVILLILKRQLKLKVSVGEVFVNTRRVFKGIMAHVEVSYFPIIRSRTAPVSGPNKCCFIFLRRSSKRILVRHDRNLIIFTQPHFDKGNDCGWLKLHFTSLFVFSFEC